MPPRAISEIPESHAAAPRTVIAPELPPDPDVWADDIRLTDMIEPPVMRPAARRDRKPSDSIDAVNREELRRRFHLKEPMPSGAGCQQQAVPPLNFAEASQI
jgi:hypothetical protein